MENEKKPTIGDVLPSGGVREMSNADVETIKQRTLEEDRYKRESESAEQADKNRRDARTFAESIGFQGAEVDLIPDEEISYWNEHGGGLEAIRGLSDVRRRRLRGITSLSRLNSSRRLF